MRCGDGESYAARVLVVPVKRVGVLRWQIRAA